MKPSEAAAEVGGFYEVTGIEICRSAEFDIYQNPVASFVSGQDSQDQFHSRGPFRGSSLDLSADERVVLSPATEIFIPIRHA